MDKNTIHVKNVELSLNVRVILAILVVSGGCIIWSGVMAYCLSYSPLAVFFVWILGTTLAILFDYFTLSSHNIIKDIKLEISEEEGGEVIYTVMKVD
jgi:hypothetical protein